MKHLESRNRPLDLEIRRTVIPSPRPNALFPGWGVKF